MADGNPASHRMSNKHRKEYYQERHTVQQRNKKKRIEKEQAAHKENLKAGITPWQKACAARAERRVHLQR